MTEEQLQRFRVAFDRIVAGDSSLTPERARNILAAVAIIKEAPENEQQELLALLDEEG